MTRYSQTPVIETPQSDRNIHWKILHDSFLTGHVIGQSFNWHFIIEWRIHHWLDNPSLLIGEFIIEWEQAVSDTWVILRSSSSCSSPKPGLKSLNLYIVPIRLIPQKIPRRNQHRCGQKSPIKNEKKWLLHTSYVSFSLRSLSGISICKSSRWAFPSAAQAAGACCSKIRFTEGCCVLYCRKSRKISATFSLQSLVRITLPFVFWGMLWGSSKKA